MNKTHRIVWSEARQAESPFLISSARQVKGGIMRVVSALLLLTALPTYAQTATEFTLDTEVPGVSTGSFQTGSTRLDFSIDLAGSGNTYNYASQVFTPSTTGSYTFGMSSAPFDPVLILYQGSYDPAQPSSNVVDLNDDGGGQAPTGSGITINNCGSFPALCPKMTVTLTGGTDYHVVISTYRSGFAVTLPSGFYVWGDPVGVGGNALPTASSVAITGTAEVGQVLTGSYTYGDTENDAQDTSGSGSSYRFVRSTDNSVSTTGDNADAATGTTGGTNKTYTLQAADDGKYLFYCVTPKASTGSTTGVEVCSSATSQVTAAVNGACGSAAGQSLITHPFANLCSAGTPGAVSSADGQYTWTCDGSGGGANDSCTSNWASNAGTGTGSVVSNGSNSWVVGSASFSTTAPATPPAGVSFSNGILSLNLTSGTSGSDATVVVHYDTPVPAGAVYWKYGRTQANPSDHWYQLPADRAVFASDRLSVTLTLTDGGIGDHDLLSNSSITDPGGPGMPSGSSVTSVPTLSEWGMIILSLLLAGMTALRLRQA